MEKIAAGLIVAFAAFCVVWAFIRQLNSDDKGGCPGKCGGCSMPNKQKLKSSRCDEEKSDT